MRIPFGQTAAALLMVVGVGGRALAAPAAPADPLAPVITTTANTVTQAMPALGTVETCSRVAFSGSFQGPDGEVTVWSATTAGNKNEVVVSRPQEGMKTIIDWKNSASPVFDVTLSQDGFTTKTTVRPADADKRLPAIVKGLDPVPMAPIVQNVLSQLSLVKEYMNSCIDITARAAVSSVFTAPRPKSAASNVTPLSPSYFPDVG